MKNEEFVATSKWWRRIRKAEAEGILPIEWDFLLIERLAMPERKSRGGIIIAETETHRDTVKDRTTELGLVLAVGPGQILETGELLKPKREIGDIVLIPNFVTWYDSFFWSNIGTQIGRVRDSECTTATPNLARLQVIFNDEDLNND